MTEREAIIHCEEKATQCNECGKDHKQLADWLKELLEYRKYGTPEEIARRLQPPVKPIKSQHAKGSMYGYCGACGKASDLNKVTHRYCYRCGNEIDWSEEQ